MKYPERIAQTVAGSLRANLEAAEYGRAVLVTLWIDPTHGGLRVEVHGRPRKPLQPWASVPINLDGWRRMCQPDGPQLVADALVALGYRACVGEPVKKTKKSA